MVSPAPLISAASLHASITSQRPPVVLDVRWRLGGPSGREGWRRGHLPGARFVDLDLELAGVPGDRGRHPLPAPMAFQASMRRAGVSQATPVVVYDEDTGIAAARGWWALRFFGHPDVRVLDGGLQAWLGAGLPLETTADSPAVDGDFIARPGGMTVVDAAGAARLAALGVLLDARAPERFRGEVEPVDRVAGHIPGALSAPATEIIGGDHRLVPAEQMRRHFAALGADGSRPVGVYCGSGVTAAHAVLALEVAGIPAALYAGSWSEWIRDPTRPIATGTA